MAVRALWVIIGLALVTGVHAEPAARSPRAVSLGEAIRLALRRNPALQGAEQDLVVAQARQVQARSGYLPRLTLTAGSVLFAEALKYHIPSGGLSMDVSGDPVLGALLKAPVTNSKPVEIGLTGQWVNFGLLSLTQPLFTGGMIRGYNRQARQGMELARAGKRRREHEVIFGVVRRHSDAVLAARLAEIGEQALVRMRTLLEVLRGAHEAGSQRVNRLEYLKSKLLVAGVATLVERLREARKLSLEGLRFAVGVEPALALAAAELPEVRPPAACQGAIGAALQGRPEAAQLEAGIRALRAGVEVAWSRYLPDLALTAGYLIDDHSISLTTGNTFWVGLALSYNLFEGLQTRGKVAEARAELRKLESQRELLRSGVSAEVRRACLAIERAGREVVLAADATRDANEYLRLAERGYQTELVEFEEVYKAQAAEALARAQSWRARHELTAAIADWHRSTGDPSPYLRLK